MMKRVWVLVLLAWPLVAAITAPEVNLQKQITEQAARQWNGKAEIKVTDVHLREVVPASAIVSAIFPNPAMGVINFEVTWEEKGITKDTMGTATVRVTAPVAVVARTIERGQPVTPADLRMEPQELSRFQHSGYFLNFDELKEKTPKVTLRTGMVLGAQYLQDTLAVSQGQLADLVHGTRAVTISTRVKILESGRIGQWVRAENISSRKPLRVRVTAPGEVRLK